MCVVAMNYVEYAGFRRCGVVPDRYRDVLTGSGAWIALVASIGGCLLR